MRKHKLSKYIVSITLTSLLGAFFGFVVYQASSYSLGLLNLGAGSVTREDSNAKTQIDKLNNLEVGTISYNKFVPPKVGKVIYINTFDKMVFEYIDGKMVGSFRLLSLDVDPPLVAGEYTVFKKEDSHKSARTGTILSNVVAFAPSYFIYGSSKNLPEAVGLSLDDSAKVFSFADTNTKVLVSSAMSSRDLTREDRDFLGFSKLATISADKSTKIPVKATAYVIKDLDTGENILELNEAAKFPIASITKLVTAMVALDNLSSDAIVKISRGAVGTYGQQGSLSVGEELKVIDLVHCLLLESSNDAAEALAEYFGRDKFLALMNAEVKRLGMADTKYLDPSGLSKGNVSTPEDLSKLMAHIEGNRSDILLITRKKSYQVDASALSNKHLWLNINRLIKDNNSYYLGGKDGFTGDALMTFAGAFSVPLTEFDHKRFSIALLRSSDRNGDVKKILDKIINSLQYEDGLSFAAVIKKKRAKNTQPVPDKNISMMFVGDIMLDRGVKQLIERRGDSDYMFPFEYVPFLKDPDIVFGNLEGPASDLGYDIGGTYSFRMDPKAITALKEAGFDALSVANNHIGDWGLTAYEDTLNRLRDAGITPVGGGLTGADARRVKIITKNGIRVGFLGFSDVGPTWLSGRDNLPSILLASDPAFESIIRDASKEVDYLVVSFHFGDEYVATSTLRQRDLAHRAVDAGAKIVIGHHPHVEEELEKYNGGVIAYSLGNFVFDQPFSKETMTGAILEIIVDKQGILQINQSNVHQNDGFQPILLEENGV